MSAASLESAEAALCAARRRTLELASRLSAEQLETVHSKLLSPLVWDIGHIAAFEDLWMSRTCGTVPLRADLRHVYDADETPRARRGELPFLRTAEALSYMGLVRARTVELLELDPDPRRIELIRRHELQHQETMLQALQIAHLPAAVELRPVEPAASGFIEFPERDVVIGADATDGFGYDNERDRHQVHLDAFELAAGPATNADWQGFIADDGYTRRELWSAEGWSWREAEDATRPLYWLDDGVRWQFDRVVERSPDEPAVHVSYWEAEAYAHYRGARLPSEAEWESAAAQMGSRALVWEWTHSEFDAYPGFRVDPYPEYSQQFFGHGYRVLRGGSRVTADAIATPTFRNWDLPGRRQIFSGVRIARSA